MFDKTLFQHSPWMWHSLLQDLLKKQLFLSIFKASRAVKKSPKSTCSIAYVTNLSLQLFTKY